MAAFGVASEGHNLAASVWVKPATASCENISVELTWGWLAEPDAELAADSATPGGDGWCRFSAVAPERAHTTLLYVHNGSEGEILVDDAVLERAPTAQAITSRPPTLSVVERRRLEAFRVRLRQAFTRTPPRPSAARQAVDKALRIPRVRPRD